MKKGSKKGVINKNVKTLSIALDSDDDDNHNKRGGKHSKQKGNKRRKGNVNNAVTKSSAGQ